MQEFVNLVLGLPFAFRVIVFMAMLWLCFAALAKPLLRILAWIPMLFNWIWYKFYKLFNGIAHLLHRHYGKKLIGVDQAVTDSFESVYIFSNKVKGALMERKFQKQILKVSFIICIGLIVWITIPTWAKIEQNVKLLTAPYNMYIKMERNITNALLPKRQLYNMTDDM